MGFRASAVGAVCIAICFVTAASAQTVKLGVINTYSGPFAAVGEQMDRGIRLYVKQHEKDLPPGVKLEIIRRDDTGPNPEVAKRMAQELITRDHVQLLAGPVYSPNALAIAPLATEAKVPFIIMNAGTAVITTKSPYIARVSFTMWQSSYPLGAWAAKSGIKKVYIAVSDSVRGSTPRRRSPRASPKPAGRSSGPCTCRWSTRTTCRSCSAPRTPRRMRSMLSFPPARMRQR